MKNNYKSAVTYLAGTQVTRPSYSWDDETYTVVTSGGYRTSVVDADGVAASFATRDLAPVEA